MPHQPAPKLPCPAGESPFHIKGGSYRGLVLSIGGTVGLDRLCEALPDEGLRAFLPQSFLASGRYDVLPLFPIMHALAQLRGLRFDDLVRAATAAQARYDAAHVYKLIFDAHGPEEVVLRIARFNTQVYDFGEYAAHALDAGRVLLEFSFIPAYLEPWFAPMHAAYAMEALRIAGAKQVTMISQMASDAGARHRFPVRSFRTEIAWR